MIDKRIIRWILFPVSLLLLIAATALFFHRECNLCMGVTVLSDTEKFQSMDYVYADFSRSLLFHGEPAAIDVENSTVYISQDIQEDTIFWQLDGALTLDNAKYQMYFLPDSYFQDLTAAAEQGHLFELIITDEENSYMQYHVVLTTLPVIRMNGEVSYINEDNKSVLDGEICVWEPNNPDLGKYTTTTSRLEWHVRGRTTENSMKKSWKLSLKTKKGENQNISLLGLGEDDDWILNAMYKDDTKVKEKLIMDIWNDMAAQTDWNPTMSTGEYLEVVINGEYCGLYLLQRRLDTKYLEMEEDDLLIKVTQLDTEPYEIVSSAIGYDEVQDLIEGLWAGNDGATIDLNNFIDINVFIQYGALRDNYTHNVYYLMEHEADGYNLFIDLWDTDLAFGIIWTPEAKDFVYDYEDSMETVRRRYEYEIVQASCPDLDERVAARWQELRSGVLSPDNVLGKLAQIENELTASGAFVRNRARWGTFYGESDTWESLSRFIAERTLWLDSYYA